MTLFPPAPSSQLPRLFGFIAGTQGPWRIEQMAEVTGAGLPPASRLSVMAHTDPTPLPEAAWMLRGMTSNERYVTREEKNALVARQEGLGRPQAVCAALIPIRKSAAWWALPQDERRQIVEAQSRHIAIGMHYLPAIARRLHHCRDLGPDEPFDFLTWFEYAPADAPAFEELVGLLRASPEWSYVEREVDLRLRRED